MTAPTKFTAFGEELVVALVLAEGPLAEPLAAVAHGFFGPHVRRCHEPVQGHTDVENHLGHGGLPASLFSYALRPATCALASSSPSSRRSGAPFPRFSFSRCLSTFP